MPAANIPVYQYLVAPAVQHNRNDTVIARSNLHLPQPIRHYRKEIATPALTSVPQRASIGGTRLIDQLDAPGGSTAQQLGSPRRSSTGLDQLVVNYKDQGANFAPGNATEHPSRCATCADTPGPSPTTNIVVSRADAARRRVRSGGGIVKSDYNMDYQQYLSRRNRTFAQNQYNYIRYGDPSVKPGASGSLANVYAPQDALFNGACTYNVPVDTSFQYQWTTGGITPDTTPTTVQVSAGHYTVVDLGNLLRATMEQHGHYYVDTASGNTHVYLLDMVYDATTGQINLVASVTNETNFPMPPCVVNRRGVDQIPAVSASRVPYFKLDQSPLIARALGFAPGNYPVNTTVVQNQDQGKRTLTSTSTLPPFVGLPPGYVKVYYKPNNAQYAQQGAVDAGARLTRLKYNTITSNAGLYGTAYGASVASAMSYGISDTPYSFKAKFAFPTKCTPTVKGKGAGAFMETCKNVLIRPR
jgi:hypothetical protein